MVEKSRRQAWAYAVPLVTLLAGVLFATSSEVANGTDIRAGRRAQLADLIAAEERRGETYRTRIADLRAEIDAVSRREAQRDSRLQAARRRAQKLGRGAGFAKVTGPGLRVTLDDAPQPQSDQQLPGNPTPNDLVVHQQDVQAVVNALWAGGARALQIMDQRVIATGAVRCVGNTLILHGVVYSPPYTITAVGDRQGMRRALRQSRQVAIYQQYVRAYGLGYAVQQLDEVTLPGHEGVPQLDYATVRPS